MAEAAAGPVKRLASISAFFPCYNDRGTIASMVVMAELALRELTDEYEIIVIDDGSSDDSPAILAELEKLLAPRVRIVLHEHNRGYGGALRTGFATASKEWIFYTDGDAQYDPAEVARLVALAGPDVDVVQGYKLRRNDPLHRVIIGGIYRHVTRLMFALRIRDVDCDFRLIRRSILDTIHLEHDSGVICLDLVRKLQDAGARFVETGVSHHFRVYGRSQFFNFRRVFRVGIDIIGLWWKLVVLKRGVK